MFLPRPNILTTLSAVSVTNLSFIVDGGLLYQVPFLILISFSFLQLEFTYHGWRQELLDWT